MSNPLYIKKKKKERKKKEDLFVAFVFISFFKVYFYFA